MFGLSLFAGAPFSSEQSAGVKGWYEIEKSKAVWVMQPTSAAGLEE